jgi:23S rRNA (cytidine1920-2'-O)/16S rRNA (cytidine1409-2'-O)-methyltransferase
MKERLDVLLAAHGYFDTRERARRSIMAGLVHIDNVLADKPGQKYAVDILGRLRIKDAFLPVSRGYHKLAAALDTFALSVEGLVCIDVGASTGGFTECLLAGGASLVYAVDCGHNQLVFSLRQDERVRVMEQTNARYLDAALFDPLPVFAVMDVSFISITLILPVLVEQLGLTRIVSLIKPQFEAGRTRIGKGGIVSDTAVHRDVLHKVAAKASEYGLTTCGVCASPILGAKGNKEFLGYFSTASSELSLASMIDAAIDTAPLVK